MQTEGRRCCGVLDDALVVVVDEWAAMSMGAPRVGLGGGTDDVVVS